MSSVQMVGQTFVFLRVVELKKHRRHIGSREKEVQRVGAFGRVLERGETWPSRIRTRRLFVVLGLWRLGAILVRVALAP